LAKFKKKKSEPTVDPNESKNESVEDVPVETPETEKSEPVPDTPSGEPPVSIAEKSEKDKKLNKLFWMRVALAIIAGIAATFIFEGIEGEERRWASIGFMVIIFFGTVIVAKTMKMQLPSSDRKKIVTQAIGSYVFLYLFSWIVSYTLTHLGSTTSGINI
jgi:multidrug transporter EmrE-like cation transporter